MISHQRPLCGVSGRALVHHRRRAVGERPVDDVGVAGDPADVGGGPEHVVVLEVEDRPVGVRRTDQVAAGRVQDALGLAGRAGGVHDVERVLGVERLGRVLARGAVDDVVPPDVAALGPRDVLPGAAYDEHVAHVGALLERLVDGRLQRRRRAAAVATVGGDHDARVAVLDPVAQGRRGEAAEDDGVRCADARARQHRDHGLGDHRHVDRDPVAGLHAQVDQRVGGLADHVLELGVGDVAGVVLGLADPVVGDPVAVAGLDVPVDAVVRRVELAADEPLREGRVRPSRGPGPTWCPRTAARRPRPRSRAGRRRPASYASAFTLAFAARSAGGSNRRSSCSRLDRVSSLTSLCLLSGAGPAAGTARPTLGPAGLDRRWSGCAGRTARRGRWPYSRAPTGRTWRPKVKVVTPANDAYQAATAVSSPSVAAGLGIPVEVANSPQRRAAGR